MELKVMPFTVSAFDPAGRTVEGYAAVFGNVDRVNDVIVKGAFAKTLAERGGKVRFLWQHDPREVIGRPMEIREDDQGLYVKAVISDTARGRDALALLRDGAINEMSIGYDPLPAQIEYAKITLPDGQEKTVRRLKEVKLYEFSLVSFAANPDAVVTALKGGRGESELATKDEGVPSMEIKYGRALSGANRKRLMTRITEIKSAVDDLSALLEETRDELEDTQEILRRDNADNSADAEQGATADSGSGAEQGKAADATKCNRGKLRDEQKALNLSQRIEKVSAIFRSLYNSPNEWGPWRVVDVYDEYLVTRNEDDNATYAVPYTIDADGNAVIRPRAEWTQGDYVFTPRERATPTGVGPVAPNETPALETAGVSKSDQTITSEADHNQPERDNAGPSAPQEKAGPGPAGTPPTFADMTLTLQLLETELSLLEV